MALRGLDHVADPSASFPPTWSVDPLLVSPLTLGAAKLSMMTVLPAHLRPAAA